VTHRSPPTSGSIARPALLGTLLVAQLMVILDISAVNVALPDMARELGIAGADVAWTITSYSLVFGSLLLLGGRAADLLGRKRVFLAGLAIFTASSLASAFAGSAETLFAARAGQGLGAALLSPAALSIITTAARSVSRSTFSRGSAVGRSRTPVPPDCPWRGAHRAGRARASSARPCRRVPPSAASASTMPTGMLMAASAVLFGTFLLLSLYMQNVLGTSPIETGLAFLPLALTAGAGAHAGSQLVSSRGCAAQWRVDSRSPRQACCCSPASTQAAAT
jgi:Major Facilitator Superfamily